MIVQNLIYEIRGQKVMLDADLARLYGIETRELKQAVRRNIRRFPADFMLELELEEYNVMISRSRSQIVTLDKKGRGSNVKYKPFVFTELGVAMLSSVLKSETAIQALQREEDLGAVNDLSEDVRKDIDNLYLAIGELSSRMEAKKCEPQRKIGFKRSDEY